MKAVLDHIGIAVADVREALAFYHDALGLEVEVPEEVPTQRVRAHFIPVGESSLELLEATAPDSPIAKYIGKRGPGIHHITLRVTDIRASLAALKARQARLIDDEPRPGAGGSLVAFIHPATAHGVLVELKQSGPVEGPVRSDAIVRHSMGNLEVVSLCDGFFALDGGAMFGVIPRQVWSAKVRPDDRNRVPLAMRPLLVRGARTMLIDAGVGDKEDAKFQDMYGLDRTRHLDHALAAAGVSADDIDIVLATHLHFDHSGGFTVRDASGRLRPRFPRARYVVRRGEWEDATHPHARNRASYRPDNFLPLVEAGVLDLVDDDQTIMPGVRVQRTGGHSAHHQMVWIESAGKSAAFVGDLMPTTAHLPDPWIMGFDLYPMETLSAKRACIQEAVSRGSLVLFEHDPVITAGYLALVDQRPVVQPVDR